MNGHSFIAAGLIALLFSALPCRGWPDADQLEEIRREQTRERHQNQLRELRGREQIEDLKRDQQLEGARKELERKRQATTADPGARQELGEEQRRLDELKNEQQLEGVRRSLQFDRAQREQNPLRQQEQIRELQRQQQLDLLRDQANKLNQDLNRSR